MARFLVRILCTLALVIAAWPAGASAAPCVMPVEPVKQKACKMACCDKAPAKAMACHTPASQTEFKAKSDCHCELKAALPVALPSEKATLSKVHLDFALPPLPPLVETAAATAADSVVFASDSSPPGEAVLRPSSPRAPPVVRV
jgi:hypothetical protein